MTISEHASVFAGRPVREFEPGGPLENPSLHAWKLGFTYDDEGEDDFGALLESLLSSPGADQIEALVIGGWAHYVGDGTGSERAVAVLAAAAPRLPNLRALFLGDITYDECEISWIAQSDVSPLLAAYPRLEVFRVRGSTGLYLGTLRHDRLRSLIVECGGLPANVVASVSDSALPELEHLELWIGDENYGREVEPEDFERILSGELFPKLRYLGLRDAENADAYAAAVAKSPLLARIRVLDLSLGTLGNEGAEALLASPTLGSYVSGPRGPATGQLSLFGDAEPDAARSPQLPRPEDDRPTGREPALPRKYGYLEKLDIHHHYVSEEVVERLRLAVRELDASDAQDADDDDRYVAVGE